MRKKSIFHYDKDLTFWTHKEHLAISMRKVTVPNREQAEDMNGQFSEEMPLAKCHTRYCLVTLTSEGKWSNAEMWFWLLHVFGFTKMYKIEHVLFEVGSREMDTFLYNWHNLLGNNLVTCVKQVKDGLLFDPTIPLLKLYWTKTNITWYSLQRHL